MNLSQLSCELPSRLRRKRKARTLAKQAEMAFSDQSFRLVGEAAHATEFIEPVAPQKAAELFDQIRQSLDQL